MSVAVLYDSRNLPTIGRPAGLPTPRHVVSLPSFDFARRQASLFGLECPTKTRPLAILISVNVTAVVTRSRRFTGFR